MNFYSTLYLLPCSTNHDQIMNEQPKKFIIITAPSGTGKTTITKYLLNKYSQLAFSVSATTRKPRSSEKNGVDYYFISMETFQQKIRSDDFVEWEMVYEGNGLPYHIDRFVCEEH